MEHEHPIQGLMETAMESIKGMVDVNTIVGDPVQTPDGSVIMPISKVGFGFVAGGSDIRLDGSSDSHSASVDHHNAEVALPFGGGSGGGVSITPIAFLVVGSHGVKIVSLDNQTHLWERMIDSAPKVIDKLQSMMKGGNAGASTTTATTGTTAGTNAGIIFSGSTTTDHTGGTAAGTTTTNKSGNLI